MTAISPIKLPSSLESDENIIDSTRVSNYKRLIEELNSFFDINPFDRKIIKVNIGQVEKLEKKLENSSKMGDSCIRLKKVEYYRPFAFVTVMSESVIHSKMSTLVSEAIGDSLDRAFPQDEYTNQGNLDIDSPQRKTKPDAQLYPQARWEERRGLPTVVVEVGLSERKRELLCDVSDWFTIQEGTIAIEAAVAVNVKLGSRDEVGGPGLLNKIFTGAIFESYLRVVRADVTRGGRQEGWRELVKRETMESTVALDDHTALDAYPTGIKVLAMGRGGNGQRNGCHQAITVPAHLLKPDVGNDDDAVLLTEEDIIRITGHVFREHENRVAKARAP